MRRNVSKFVTCLMLSQPVDGLPTCGFETELIAIGSTLITLFHQFGNSKKHRLSARCVHLMRTLVLTVVVLGWTASVSAVPAEPSKPASRFTVEPIGWQVSEPIGESVNAEVEIDLETRRLIRNRIVGLAIFFTGVLLLLGLSFAYLRLDHATRGFHSGRLQLFAVFLGLMIVGICFFFLNKIVLTNP